MRTNRDEDEGNRSSVRLVDSAQILQRNVAFEIPALKKQIAKCQQIRDESNTRYTELEKNIHEIEKQYAQLAQEMSIQVITEGERRETRDERGFSSREMTLRRN